MEISNPATRGLPVRFSGTEVSRRLKTVNHLADTQPRLTVDTLCTKQR
uniref:Uncharacterized protein n=1 Tax=Anguilla anguilla TaxID=7936 RepID=A0A0E9XBD0_ANGAN